MHWEEQCICSLKPDKQESFRFFASILVFAGDDPEHLPSWCLDIEERSIRVNYSGESESLHLLLQPYRIIRPQLKPRPALRLLL